MLLELKNIEAAYGNIKALKGINTLSRKARSSP